jgi:hypothetical protein
MRRPDLVADCARCAALCCVAPSFEASEDFAVDKPSGARCQHLEHDDRCAIHAQRIERGFPGCVSFECYGAGQRATRTFQGADRDELYLLLNTLHELLFLLTEGLKLCPPSHAELGAQLTRAIEALDAFEPVSIAQVRAFDLSGTQAHARALLREVGEALGGRRARSQLQVLR